jgi:hypothetical protein
LKGIWMAVVATVAVALLAIPGPSLGASSTPSISVTPGAAVVGTRITITGAGYPADEALNLEWGTVNASWEVSGNPPQLTGAGVRVVQVEVELASVLTASNGSFTVSATVPSDYGGDHVIQAEFPNGTAITGRSIFDLEPSFEVSPALGAPGTPIEVTATGLGYGEYSTSYHLYWDNSYVGYFTAITTRGATNFTFYASGTTGTHYIEIYQGYPGPGYLNPQQGPPSSETQSNFPPYIPFRTEFNITGSQTGGTTGGSALAQSASLVVLAASLSSVGLLTVVAVSGPEKRNGYVKTLAAIVIVAAVAAAGVSAYIAFAPGGNATSYVPQESVVRPEISIPLNNATSGPRISVTPDIASVGENVTVTGGGFAPDALVPLSWTTVKGSNLLGYEPVAEPLRNVTANSGGSFSFTMETPSDLGGLHFIASGSMTEKSNGTVFIERTASINATQGPSGTVVAITMLGVGWTFNTNIAALDYDNTYIGYGCGFNSGGNVTFYLTVTGAPGIHTVDIYPSIWWGTSNYYNQSVAEYRYPLLTPQDHPQLMPSFHFSFLVTNSGSEPQAAQSAFAPFYLLGLTAVPLASTTSRTLHAKGAEVKGGPGTGR